MIKNAEKFSLIANAIISLAESTEGEKLFVSRSCSGGDWGENFYTFFIHF